MRVRWVANLGYSYAYLGPYVVAQTLLRNDLSCWQAEFYIPGPRGENFEDEDEAKKHIETEITRWLAEISKED